MTRRHQLCLLGWLIAGLIIAVRMVTWALDDKPPFKSLAYVATPAKAGQGMRVIRKVWRDPKRTCRIEFSRSIVDRQGAQAPVVTATMSPEEREIQMRDFPGAITEIVLIPLGLESGPAKIKTTLLYFCNPMHELPFVGPIVVETVLDVEVLPP